MYTLCRWDENVHTVTINSEILQDPPSEDLAQNNMTLRSYMSHATSSPTLYRDLPSTLYLVRIHTGEDRNQHHIMSYPGKF